MGTKTHEERVQDMQLAIKAGVPSVKSPLAAAFLEDEAVRHTSEQRARDYVMQCEAERNEMPNWMWMLLYFVLGMLFCMTIEPLQHFVMDMIKLSNGGM